jgi:hypothetical protein
MNRHMRIVPPLLAAIFLIALTGCQSYAPSNAVRTVAMSGSLDKDKVYNAVIEAARDTGLPPMTKMDKANGIIEFGSFELPEMGLTAQVRIVSDTSMELTVRRGSAFIPIKAESQGDTFRDQITKHLASLEKPAQ